ncbi:hypothetical protein GOQ27_08420 [Clostridium sp. D2Q-11]|uniref:Uncharacterized protein n=1 Tax=Anaeromonas frigoriresistens TaxID=2683708 RepID=A0A942UY61_9FIRM|nr:hypothetical protein [Anaeromonas frigoriresistens]MBS4538486.1 hypothetical protein [Anaeromonas frigoriresistens]
MKIKTIPIFLILQGISILISTLSNILNKEVFKYITYELPTSFNYLSIIIGIIFLICGIGVSLKYKEMYKLSLVVSVLFAIYLLVNIMIVLFMGVQIGALLVNLILLIIYLFIIKNLNQDIRSFS